MEVLGLSVYFHLIHVFIFAVHLLQTAYSWVLILYSDNLSLLTVDIIVFRSIILLFVFHFLLNLVLLFLLFYLLSSYLTSFLEFHFTFLFHFTVNPLHCSCLENPRDGGAWWVAVSGSHGVGHDWNDLAAAVAFLVVPYVFIFIALRILVHILKFTYLYWY